MDYSRLKKKKKKEKVGYHDLLVYKCSIFYLVYVWGFFLGGGIVMTSFSVCKILHVDTNKPVLLFTGALYV